MNFIIIHLKRGVFLYFKQQKLKKREKQFSLFLYYFNKVLVATISTPKFKTFSIIISFT